MWIGRGGKGVEFWSGGIFFFDGGLKGEEDRGKLPQRRITVAYSPRVQMDVT